MEKDKEEILFKDHSSRSCISLGYRLYMSNFKRIFRASWLAAIVFAVVFSIGGTMMFLSPQWGPMIFCVLMLVNTLFASCGLTVLKQHQQTGAIGWATRWGNIDAHIFSRTLKCVLCTLLIFIVAGGLLGGASFVLVKYLSNYTAIGAIAVLTGVVIALLLPMTYTNTRYVLTDGIGYWRNLKERYGVGLHRWGFIFIVTFVTMLVELVLSLFTSLPSTILSLANMQATLGSMMGDPYAMPSYIVWLSSIVFLLIGFIQAFVFLSSLFPIYYMYGAIETREKEQKEFNTSKK